MEIWRGHVLWRGYIHPHPHPHTQLKKSGIPHTHTHTHTPVNAGIPRQNGDKFEQYPRRRVYLPSLMMMMEIYFLIQPISRDSLANSYISHIHDLI